MDCKDLRATNLGNKNILGCFFVFVFCTSQFRFEKYKKEALSLRIKSHINFGERRTQKSKVTIFEENFVERKGCSFKRNFCRDPKRQPALLLEEPSV